MFKVWGMQGEGMSQRKLEEMSNTSIMQQLNFVRHLPDYDIDKARSAILELFRSAVPDKYFNEHLKMAEGWDACREETLKNMELI